MRSLASEYMRERLRVCYFGGYRPDYPRHKFYASVLKELGVGVIECCVSHKLPTLPRMWALLKKYWSQKCSGDVIYVEEFNHNVIPLAWLLARLTGKGLVFDPGVSSYDELVRNSQQVPEHSLYAHYLWLNNWLAFHLPDLIIWFTPVDMEYFQSLFDIGPKKSAWLPPGIDLTLFTFMPMPAQARPLVVHFDGNMSPTHGIDIMLRAAALLPEDDFYFEIIGGGMTEDMRALATDLKLTNVNIPGYVSREELKASMQRAHICLGAFRADGKLHRSLYTKEIQSMLCGRPLVTGFGEAKARCFRDGEDLIMVKPDDPHALANVLMYLRDNPAVLHTIATNALRSGQALLSPENTGQKLVGYLQEVVNRQHRVVGQNFQPPL